MAGFRGLYRGSTELSNRRVLAYASHRMVVELEMDRQGIARVAVSDQMRDAVRSLVVLRALPYAVKISPRRTREYVNSWRVSNGQTVIAGMRRVAVKLVNISDHAAAVEWGRGGNSRVLGRTLAHLHGTTVDQLHRPPHQRRPWDPSLHPRGARGRFIPRVD